MKSVAELFSMRGKTVFITGGAGYLGTAMCEALAELGADIVIGARGEKKSAALAAKLAEEFDVRTSGIQLDITDPDSLQSAFDYIQKEYGRLDVLINNAWSGNKNSFESISLEDWRYDIDVCLNGVFYTIKTALPHLKETKGVIVNIASMYGHVAPDYRMYEGTDHVNPPSYGAAKAGVIQFTRYLSSFLSPHGIRVNAISPGPFPFADIVSNADFMDKLRAKTMVNRLGKPEIPAFDFIGEQVSYFQGLII